MAESDAEARVKSCYSTWADSYHEDYFGAKAPYPPVHRDLVLRLVRESGARTLLDAGCGPATFLRELTDSDLELYGFDLTPEMVEEAAKVMADRGHDGSRVWQGSVTDAEAFRPPGVQPYDAAICIGVLPHVPEAADAQVIANLRDSVRTGGLVVAEARNQLFGLFTVNRYTYDFFASELIGAPRGEGVDPEALEGAMEELRSHFRMDMPPVRTGKVDEPGYDQVLSRTHNPLLLSRAFADAGFRNVRTLFYHFHWLPPILQGRLPDAYRAESLAREEPEDWRGHFMASAFLIAAERA